ncbi:uncharacterized protein LOC107401972 isoform X3 [Peromyscus maniculatus bairdii]|uniref:uncharacterized protein LOC107401972 isoform X3 n=1 Tax=Peromyscus maniculatus bairdii TaxID=230844 RepID=UPI00077DD28A
MLRSPLPLESVFASQKWKGTTSGGRSRAHSLAPHRPSPVTSAVGLPGGLPCPRGGPPCLLREGNVVWLFTTLGRASWVQSQLAAAWARSPASLGPRSRCLRSSPTVARLFFFFLPSPFVVVANLVFLSSLLPFFSLSFSFPRSTGSARGRGRLGELWNNVLVQRLQKASGWNSSARLADVVVRLAGSWLALPRARAPRSLDSWPSLLRVSPQLQRLGHCSWLLAEPWKPPRLNAAPADVTADCDQSAPRGPSVNHSAFPPGRGECGETAFRGSVAVAPRGAGDGSEMSWPLPGDGHGGPTSRLQQREDDTVLTGAAILLSPLRLAATLADGERLEAV